MRAILETLKSQNDGVENIIKYPPFNNENQTLQKEKLLCQSKINIEYMMVILKKRKGND